jgi:hypothetical protein
MIRTCRSCKLEKDIQLFPTSQRTGKVGTCRKCQQEANQRKRVSRFTPADMPFGRMGLPGAKN